MNRTSKTISLKDFSQDFSQEQMRVVEEETQYYHLITSFKKAREEKGLTQAELAHMAKINRTTLSQIESGLRNVTIGTLAKLAAAMNMKLDVKLKAV